MNGQRRQDQRESPQPPPAATGDMRRADGPGIRLGRGPRRVTGNDLSLVRALVSGNDQTIDDLSVLRAGGPDAPGLDPARRPSRRYVTECWLDRANGRLSLWLGTCARVAVRQVGRAIVAGRPSNLPVAEAVRDRPADGPGFARRRQAA